MSLMKNTIRTLIKLFLIGKLNSGRHQSHIEKVMEDPWGWQSSCRASALWEAGASVCKRSVVELPGVFANQLGRTGIAVLGRVPLVGSIFSTRKQSRLDQGFWACIAVLASFSRRNQENQFELSAKESSISFNFRDLSIKQVNQIVVQKETLPVAWKSEGVKSFGWFHRVIRLVRATPH